MGTNYYLHGNPKLDVCSECGKPKDDDDTAFHIGKSSIGHVFTWRGRRPPHDEGILLETPADCIKYIIHQVNTYGCIIKDEYGQVQELDEFISFIYWKRNEQTMAHCRKTCKHTEFINGDCILFGDFS